MSQVKLQISKVYAVKFAKRPTCNVIFQRSTNLHLLSESSRPYMLADYAFNIAADS
jgi:hypothetical protein